MTKHTDDKLIEPGRSNDSLHITDHDGSVVPFRVGERIAVLDAGRIGGGPYVLRPNDRGYPATVFFVDLERLGRHYVEAGAIRRIGPALGELLDKLRSHSEAARAAVADAARRLEATATLEPPGADDPLVQLVHDLLTEGDEQAPWVVARQRLQFALGWPVTAPLDRWIEHNLTRLVAGGTSRVEALELMSKVLEGERLRLDAERVAEEAEKKFTGGEPVEPARGTDDCDAMMTRETPPSTDGDPAAQRDYLEGRAETCETCRGTRRVFGGKCPRCQPAPASREQLLEQLRALEDDERQCRNPARLPGLQHQIAELRAELGLPKETP